MHAAAVHFLLAFGWVTLAGIVCVLRNNNGLIDIFWGLGFAWISAWTMTSLAPVFTAPYLINALVWLWALRLSIYLFRRNWNKPEDFRYADFRKKWKGSWVLNSILRVYLLQGLMLAVLAAPISILNSQAGPEFNGLVIAGILIAFIGIVIEGVSDYQKSSFKYSGASANAICQHGLWKYSRHPNYLGEILMWFGIACTVVEVPFGFMGFVTVALITFLLYRVSGVPYLEAKRRDDPDYQKYMQSTGAIFPKF